MRLALFLPTEPNEMWDLAVQMGVTAAVTGLPRHQPGTGPAVDYMSLLHLKARFADAGLEVAVIESSPPMDKIRLGQAGRDEEIDAVCELLTSMGAVGIPVWCYNFMAVFNWMRTSTTTRTRGGALVTSFDYEAIKNAPLTEAGVVADQLLWDNLGYFLDRVVPVAERAKVKLALHPDDPPLSPIRGVARICRSVQAFKRVIDLAPSEYNGITFCQGCFTEMGADIPATVRDFGMQKKIHFAHFRDIRGTADHFEEAFHDAGQTNMVEAMRAYRAIGFDGPIRPDHVPTMTGDSNEHAGYTTRGRLFAVGYMKGIMEALDAG